MSSPSSRCCWTSFRWKRWDRWAWSCKGSNPTERMQRERQLAAGGWFADDDQHVAMLGRILAANLGKKVGDEFEIYENERFRIVGIYDGGNIFDNGAMIVPLGRAATDAGSDAIRSPLSTSRSTHAPMRPRSTKSWPAIQRSRPGRLGHGHRKLRRDRYQNPNRQSRMAWSISTIALVIGAIGMLNTMIISVFERTNEIGILCAIGWRRSRSCGWS